jgi:hypothetical protein
MRKNSILFLFIALAVIFVIFLTNSLPAEGVPLERQFDLTGPENADTLAVLPGSGAGRDKQPLPAGEHLPLMVRWSNWRPEFGPALVYARERDLDGMLRMAGPVDKMLMVTSYAEASRLMARAAELQTAGVTTVGLNSENGLTPGDEMRTLDNPDPATNLVSRVGKLATQNGFDFIWGPVRRQADTISDEAVRTMMAAGMRGIALQEQKFIETQPAQTRLAEVNRTRARYLRLAEEMNVDDFAFHVQIMHERCPNLDNCVTFVQMLEDIPVDSIAIWSNGPIPASFVESIRGN